MGFWEDLQARKMRSSGWHAEKFAMLLQFENLLFLNVSIFSFSLIRMDFDWQRTFE